MYSPQYNISIYVHTILAGKNDTVEDVSSVFNFLSKFHNISSWKIDIASPSLYKSESYENIRSRYDNVHYLDDKLPLAELLCFLSVYQRLYLIGKYIIQ